MGNTTSEEKESLDYLYQKIWSETVKDKIKLSQIIAPYLLQSTHIVIRTNSGSEIIIKKFHVSVVDNRLELNILFPLGWYREVEDYYVDRDNYFMPNNIGHRTLLIYPIDHGQSIIVTDGFKRS